jgi:hypothetical protein
MIESKRISFASIVFLLCTFFTSSVVGQSKQETKDWNRAEAQNTSSAYKEYLKKYPNGHYSEIVRTYVDQTGDFKRKIFTRDLFFGKPKTGSNFYVALGSSNSVNVGYGFGSRFCVDFLMLNFRQLDKYNANSLSIGDIIFSLSTSRQNGPFIEAGVSALYLNSEPTNVMLQEIREMSNFVITTKDEVESLVDTRWDYFGGFGYKNSIGKFNFGIQYRLRVINNNFNFSYPVVDVGESTKHNLRDIQNEILIRFGIDIFSSKY